MSVASYQSTRHEGHRLVVAPLCHRVHLRWKPKEPSHFRHGRFLPQDNDMRFRPILKNQLKIILMNLVNIIHFKIST